LYFDGRHIMIDIRKIRENADFVRQSLRRKHADTGLLDQALAADHARRALVAESEQLRNDRNRVSKEIGALKKSGRDTETLQVSMRDIGRRIKDLENELRECEAQRDAALLRLPNLPHASVPEGADASGNVAVRTWGRPAAFAFEPLNHIALGERLGVFDFPRGAKMSGAGFPLLVGDGARLQRALIRFMLDLHTREHGYREIYPPVLCHSASMTGTGQLPKMAEDMYGVQGEDLWLVPTAEVPVTNFYREEFIAEPLPVALVAHSLCFRREAGAAGKDTRGFIRVHQFDKVEMVRFVSPGRSYEELETLVGHAETVLQRLGLPYRVLALCAGDLSFAAAKCYDIELWAPGQNDWLEVSSCSNFEDFQARRADIRYRDANGKAAFVHTLNGSGVALPRLMVAILENGQQADGSVALPAALVPYMDGQSVLRPQPAIRNSEVGHL